MKEMKSKTPYMISLRDRILDTAMQAFAAKGIKAVKMDDIAQALSISKRTLYETYENKEVLLLEGVKKLKAKKDEDLKTLYGDRNNVMEILLTAYRTKVNEFKKTCPEFYSDIVKYPSVTAFFQQDKKQFHNSLVGFLNRGVEEGYFRKDVNFELVATLLSSLMEIIMTKQLYKTYSIEEIFHNFLFVSLRGICTPEGVKHLDKYVDVASI